jgi:hypothetical protein
MAWLINTGRYFKTLTLGIVKKGRGGCDLDL